MPPNERMQLTWLIGAPSRPVSVHRRACGRRGLGSAATQLMRAVGRLLAVLYHYLDRVEYVFQYLGSMSYLKGKLAWKR